MRATVLTVSVGVPFPPLTIAELKVHAGAVAAAGVIAHVRFTVELNPPAGATVTVEVAEPPGLMLAGASAVAVNLNDDTVRLAVAVLTRFPEVAVTVKLKFPPAVDGAVVTLSGTLVCPPPKGTEIKGAEQEAPEGSPEQVTVAVP